MQVATLTAITLGIGAAACAVDTPGQAEGAEAAADAVEVVEAAEAVLGPSVELEGCTLQAESPRVDATGAVRARASYRCAPSDYFERELRVWLQRSAAELPATEVERCIDDVDGGGGIVESEPDATSHGLWRTGIQIFVYQDSGREPCRFSAGTHTDGAWSSGSFAR